MSSKKKILEEVLPLRLIREVENWPVLYVRDCPERNNAHFRNKVWQQVAKGLIENWDTLPQEEKNFKAMELCRKWRNLRDTFKRQLAIDRKVREGHNIKRKEYVYFKHMTFLLPHVNTGDAADEPRPLRARRELRQRPGPSGSGKHAKRKHKNPPTDEIDEDKHFLMSLLPSFKRMSVDEKLTAKVEILNVIREVHKHIARRAETVLPVLEVGCVYEPRDDALGLSGDDEPSVKREIFAVDVSEEDHSLSDTIVADNSD